jgi:hypothetical protein
MTRLAAIVVASVVGAACTPDSVPFEIEFRLDEECGGSRCEQIMTRCDAAIGLQIVDAASGELYVDQCTVVEGGTQLCDLLDEFEIDPELLPNRMIRIELAIWPLEEEEVEDRCPEIVFTAGGEYQSGQPAPAIAGRGYFEVGSNDVAPLTLGCVYKELLDAAECRTDTTPHISTLVIDFDNRLPVPSTFSTRLEVSVAEPTFNQVTEEWSINQGDLVDLMVTALLPDLRWETDYPFNFAKTACLQVLSNDIGAAATIRCYPASPTDLTGNLLDAEGTFLEEGTLDKIQQALGGGPLPMEGLVVGQVLDMNGNPAEGATVSPSFGTVQYLSPDLTATDGLTATSSSGAFVSTDAPFEGESGETNFWNANRLDEFTPDEVIGGRVNDKVTIVILKFGTESTKD